MGTQSDLFTLPAGPAELCFDKNEFMKVCSNPLNKKLIKKTNFSFFSQQKTFSSDKFLHEYRNAAGLETMRDDLGLYLKVLRSAMIELINEDYADFVDLSANLIGLDQSINGIQTPMGQLREEILTVKMVLTENMNEITDCLEEKKCLRENKRGLLCLGKVQVSLNKLSELLNSSDSIKPTLLERMTLESVQLKFNIKFCEKFLTTEQQDESRNVHKMLLERVHQYFLLTLGNKDVDGLERCLRIYSTLDECLVAEEIFRKEIVSNYLNSIISESSLQNCPQGLSGIYSQIFDFIAIKMKDVLALTGKHGKIKGFDFLINSYWIEIEQRLETNLSSIFAPGNPESFYQKYKTTIDFLEKIESVLIDEDLILKFRETIQYKKFQIRWNLPVYFQIRFQEIGGTLETACNKVINKQIINNSNELKFTPFNTVISCITKCWQDGIFLPQLFNRFWKLTLQCISRITNWIDEALKQENWILTDKSLTNVDFFVLIYTDVLILLKKLPQILNLAVENIPSYFSEHKPVLEKCLNDSRNGLLEKLKIIEKCVLKELIQSSIGYIKQVGDIPRLFRKTNKETPNKPCTYLEHLLEPSQTFSSLYKGQIGDAQIVLFLEEVFSSLTIQ